MKKLSDKLVEECSKTIEELKIASKNEHNNKRNFAYCTLCFFNILCNQHWNWCLFCLFGLVCKKKMIKRLPLKQ